MVECPDPLYLSDLTSMIKSVNFQQCGQNYCTLFMIDYLSIFGNRIPCLRRISIVILTIFKFHIMTWPVRQTFDSFYETGPSVSVLLPIICRFDNGIWIVEIPTRHHHIALFLIHFTSLIHRLHVLHVYLSS